jgi:autotransporter-associated beta strand protein
MVSDISGNLSIVKDGPGELRIERNITFSGGLSVKQGSATLVNCNNAPYEYFKVTVKETAASSSNPIYDAYTITTGTASAGKNSRSFNISEFGLYDSAGKRVNAYQNSWNGDESIDWTFETLQPGQIAPYPSEGVSVFRDAYAAWAWYIADNKIFSASFSTPKYRYAQYHWTDGEKYMQIDNPETWLSLVQRLKNEDIGKPAMMDVNFLTRASHQPTAIEVFASADGRHWDSLFVTNDIEVAESKYMWLSNGASADVKKPDSTIHPKFPLARTTQKPVFDFAAPSSFSVAAGATLKLVGSPVIVSNLVVSAAGAGTLEGAFSFAETGTLEVQDLPEEFPVTLPGTYSGCSGFANIANWSVTCGGEAARLSVNIIDGKIVISKLGMHIIIK